MSACLTWMVSVGLIGSLVLGPVYGDPEQIKAKPGENVTLQCRGSKDDTFRALKWVRRELESEGYVFYFRENRQYESNQLLSFRGRLDLRDPEMKDGDFSVILKNVRISDTGSYECQVGTNGNKPKLINNMSLKVEYPEKTAKPGEDVVLQCQVPTDAEIVMTRWSRPDLKSEGYVYIFKDGRLDVSSQHEAFRGRVDLRDPEMKEGDFSVILKNVRISDTGSYECYVGTNGNKPKLINNRSLEVEYPVITAEPGQTVTLPCRAPSNSEIRTVEWTRPDLDPKYVFVYWNNQPDPVNQHPSFKERVELKDSQMKDGDVSVTLKNVTFNDTGTYECRVLQGQSKPPELISIIHLRVSAGHREKHRDDGQDKDRGDNHGHGLDTYSPQCQKNRLTPEGSHHALKDK
ncbi:polymeric immunoglobulin receptor-like isoform X2 [Mastacembelus armatus]|uniref:polymeric immunoglobulin receptor-like isoform X2 n=1 Tax=Mastacembelus armatus TaxID=205130 RepID=UPI000E464D00|nr:polymeric immunoglobulin receptor-like isoform X2 [Mastacembelus armatus]